MFSAKPNRNRKGLTMDREQAIHEVKHSFTSFLQPAKKRGTYVCPLCGNGKGSTGDGLSIIPGGDGTRLKCFKCGESGSVIDFYMKDKGLSDVGEALKQMYEICNISIDAPTKANKPLNAEKPTNTPTEAEKPTETPQTDYTAYYKQCKDAVQDTRAQEYLATRGISDATISKYWIGYDSKTKYVIVPVSTSFYIARNTDANSDHRYNNPKGASIDIFNADTLYADNGHPVYVVEGVFDALSILDVGGDAIALNSTANVNKLLSILEDRKTAKPLILCLDNDESGRNASTKLAEGLQQMGISYYAADICPGCKDANELLTKDRAQLKSNVDAIRARATKPYNTALYIAEAMQTEIADLRAQSNRKTGFSNLDAEIGSLYAGLYCIGAISSLGKTTFAYQLCDQLAEQGSHVLYFSLEQSRLELVSKSISRLTAIADYKTAVSSIQIRTGAKGANIADATAKYLDAVKDRVSIIEGNYDCTPTYIADTARAYKASNEVTPVIVVDYLQVLTPELQRADTRANTDNALVSLKRLSRELNTPVICICSLNRSNYLTPIDFEAFKESGGIEFTSDVVWGLQLACMHDEVFNKEGNIKAKREKVAQAKAAIPRDIELVCLKNRYGKARYSVGFQYYPQYDYFVPGNDGFYEAVDTELPWKDAKTI